MSKKFSTLALCFSLVLIYSVFAQCSFAADVETIGDLKVSGMIDNTGGEGIRFPDGYIQTSACTTCASGILSISLGGTGATSASEALANLGGVNESGDTMTGNLSVPALSMSGNLTLPATTASTGVIKSGASIFIHSYGTMNFFAGENAGNTTMIGSRNTGVGDSALHANSDGGWNAAVGSYALVSNTEGGSNSALGSHALASNTTGSNNTFIGYNSGPGTATQLTNAAAIGANAKVSASNSIVLGGTGDYVVKVGIGKTTPTETLDVLGNIRLNKKDIYLADGTDVNHGLGWYGTGKAFASETPGGPVLYGYTGGILGTTAGGQKVVMKWNWSGGSDFYGYVRFNTLSGGSTAACLDANNTISACSSDARMKKA